MTAQVDVLTFGCRLNAYESEVIRCHAEAAAVPDTVVVNTCAVTAEAERKGRQAIRRIRRERPSARIIVTGCAAQIDPARYSAMPEVDRVIGNSEKLRAEHYAAEGPGLAVSDVFSVREGAGHLVAGFDGHTRAFIEVQQGCDHRCTFCIIPFGRGNSRSVPIGVIVDRVRQVIRAGYREVVLTGVDITGYGTDLPGRPGLGQMVRRLLVQVPELPRLRLSSLDPVEIDDDLWRLIGAEPRLMPHLHLSLQSGDDLVLKRMKRRHDRAQALATCARARAERPDIALGADLIAGFPTETEAMFERTLDLVATAALDYVHVFPYSARPGTPAARMPPVASAIVRERAARLREVATDAMSRSVGRRVGTIADVLVERGDTGRTPHFAAVRLPPGLKLGEIIPIRLTGAIDHMLQGEPA